MNALVILTFFVMLGLLWVVVAIEDRELRKHEDNM